MNRPPKRKLVARMRESRRRRPALLIDEAETLKGLGARPDVFIAHKRELGDGEPIAGGDVVAVRGGEWDHDFAGGADFCRDGFASVYAAQDISIVEGEGIFVRREGQFGKERRAYESDPDLDGRSL